MTTTTTPEEATEQITDKYTHEQMIERANTQLEVNAKECQQLQTMLASIDTELATLESRNQARNQLVTTSTNTVAAARSKLQTLDAQVLISEGTTAHEGLVKAQKEQAKTLARVEKEHAALQTRTNGEAVTDTARREVLLLDHAQHEDRLSALSTQDVALEQAKLASFTAIGSIEYADVRGQIDGAKERIAETERELEQARQTLNQVVQDGVQRLDPWGEHSLRIRDEKVIDDATTRILEKCLAYVQTLLADGMQLSRGLPGVSSVANAYVWWYFLTIERDQLYVNVNLQSRQGQAFWLERAAHLEQILQEYRQTHR